MYQTIMLCLFSCCLLSCTNKKPTPRPLAAHYREVGRMDNSRLYIDTLSNQSFLQSVQSAAQKSRLLSFRIGFQQPALQMKDGDEVWQRFFQYELYKNWKAIGANHTYAPVYFQPTVKIKRSVDEAILVFEVPDPVMLDTLIFQEPNETWGVQKFVLHPF